MYRQEVKWARKAGWKKTNPRERLARSMEHVNKLKQQVYQLMVYLLDDHVSYLQDEAETYVGTCLRVPLFRVATRVKLETLVAHIHALSLSFRYQQRARTGKKRWPPGRKPFYHYYGGHSSLLLSFSSFSILLKEVTDAVRKTKTQER